MTSDSRQALFETDVGESLDPAGILIVDDHRENIRALEAVLEPLGQPLISVESGEEALRALLYHDVAVILLDVRMTGMDGVETARFIRSRPTTRHIPIIFLTAMASDAEQIELAYAAGAIDYVTKPFEPSILRAKVMAFVTLRRERAQRMRQARALARAEAAAQAVRTLQSLSDVALAHLELAPLAEELLDRACVLFQARGARLLIGQTSDDRLQRLSDRGPGWADEDPTLEPAVRELLAAGSAALLTPDDHGWSGLAARGARQLVAIPLRDPDQADSLGLLLLSSDLESAFDGGDLSLLELAGERIAAAVIRAQRFEYQRELVETLQRSLLPAELPQHPRVELAARYLPEGSGNRVGGDWYDALNLADQKVALMIGDVTGHGVWAASRMGELRNALRAYAVEGHSPARALTELDRFVHSTFGAGMAATVLFAILDLRSRSLTLARAGHPPPVVRAPDGTVRVLDSGGTPPLGVGVLQQATEFTYALADGETLLLYTDGLIERRAEPIDVGIARLMTALGAGAAQAALSCDRVLERVLGDERPGDDVAILAAYVRPREHGPLLFELAAEPESVAVARNRLGDWLRYELPDLSPVSAGDVVLALSEAATNAVRHAYAPAADGGFVVSAVRDGTGLEVTVRDRGAWRSRPTEGGRGLNLMHAICDEVTVQSDEDGTLVRMRWVDTA